MSERFADARVRKVVTFFEGLRVEDLPRLAELYAADARFKDPFNEVRGVAQIDAIFRHMFHSLERPRFVIREAVTQGDQCFMSWDFVFAMKRGARAETTVRGASHLHFDRDGLIDVHRDYWDAAEELYEKLPVLGALMRWLKRRVNA